MFTAPRHVWLTHMHELVNEYRYVPITTCTGPTAGRKLGVSTIATLNLHDRATLIKWKVVVL